MLQRLPAVLAVPCCASLLCALMLGGCVARFEQPRLDEPHAVVKLRINYHSFPNTTLHESIQLNRTEVDVTPRGGRGSLDTPLTTAVRVRPEPALWHAYSTFSHVVSHVEHRSRQITEQYPCGTQTIGSITSTRYCTRYRTEWYDVTVNDTIVDAACEATAQHLPKVGATYLLQYDFYEHRRCSLKCYEQQATPDGGFTLSPCR